MKYITNFADEYFGKQHEAGDTVTVPKDGEEQLQGAVKDGRLTKIEDGDPVVPALGADATEVDPLDHDGNGKKGGSKPAKG